LLRSAEVKPLFYRFVRLSKVGRLLFFFDVTPRASGQVPFELGVCARHVGRESLKTKRLGKVKEMGRSKIEEGGRSKTNKSQGKAAVGSS
jgi:hypothetical protein